MCQNKHRSYLAFVARGAWRVARGAGEPLGLETLPLHKKSVYNQNNNIIFHLRKTIRLEVKKSKTMPLRKNKKDARG
jgi:hypothetical protein